MPKKDIAVIQLRTATRERLKEIDKKGESYDAIINRILDDRNISGAGATWAFYQTLQGMTYRGLLNHIKNGTDGYRILAASSETDPHDIWIY